MYAADKTPLCYPFRKSGAAQSLDNAEMRGFLSWGQGLIGAFSRSAYAHWVASESPLPRQSFELYLVKSPRTNCGVSGSSDESVPRYSLVTARQRAER